MRSPAEWYQMHAQIAEQFPHLRPAQQRGLTWWVYGTILAGSACQNAVITALLMFGRWAGVRQYLREWLYDGADKAAPCQTQVEVRHCFAPLLGWVVRWWQGRDLALAIDATAHGDRVVALVVSVLYRGTALPVAWHILPAQQAGAWLPSILPSWPCWSNCSRRSRRAGASSSWRTGACGARACGAVCGPCAGIRCCASRRRRPSARRAGGARP